MVQEPPLITFPDEEEIEEEVTLAAPELDDTEIEYQPKTETQSRALVVRQDRSIISFFKSVHPVEIKDTKELLDKLKLK